MRRTVTDPVSLLAFPPSQIPPASLVPYLSSATVGWQDIIAEAFHEPREMEGWSRPADRDVRLSLFIGGSMRLERRQRQARRSWTEQIIHSHDLILRPNSDPADELRWWNLSTTPIYSLLLRINKDRFTSTIAEMAVGDPTRLAIIDRVGFQDPFLSQIALAIWRELQEGAPTGNLFAQSAAQLIAVHLVRHYTTQGEITASGRESAHRLTAKQLDRVIACIRDHAGQSLTLEMLAQQAGFSPYHFTRLFRQTTGETPHQFVLRQRIEHARCLVAETTLPLAQIAQESGFAHQSHFTRIFKRYLGMTPHAYRQECSS